MGGAGTLGSAYLAPGVRAGRSRQGVTGSGQDHKVTASPRRGGESRMAVGSQVTGTRTLQGLPLGAGVRGE